MRRGQQNQDRMRICGFRLTAVGQKDKRDAQMVFAALARQIRACTRLTVGGETRRVLRELTKAA
jgi:16S rRNA G1207 methylase RsmC